MLPTVIQAGIATLDGQLYTSLDACPHVGVTSQGTIRKNDFL